MANDRQLKANRANSAKSTGPRSTGGKKRAGKNAYRHGLSLSVDLTANAKQVENLARKIAGGSGSKIVWEHAITAAQAQLDLTRVQRVKIALIERVLAGGTVDAASVSASKLVQRVKRILAGRDVFPQPVDPLSTMPTEEPERSAEALRRALPELLKLVRYERRALLRRDRALRDVIKSRYLA
jgi:hypothetical protein